MGPDPPELSLLEKLDPDRPPFIEQDPAGQCPGLHAQVRPPAGRRQVGPGGAVAPPPPLAQLSVADTVLNRAVVVLVERQPGLLSPQRLKRQADEDVEAGTSAEDVSRERGEQLDPAAVPRCIGLHLPHLTAGEALLDAFGDDRPPPGAQRDEHP